jgi:hypothetical protein
MQCFFLVVDFFAPFLGHALAAVGVIAIGFIYFDLLPFSIT